MKIGSGVSELLRSKIALALTRPIYKQLVRPYKPWCIV